jgi:hypothetical protein
MTAENRTETKNLDFTADRHQLPDDRDGINLRNVGRYLVALGCRRADVEHPGYLRIIMDDGGVIHLGTSNGPWAFDVFRSYESEQAGDQPAYSQPVSATHCRTAEGIARWVVGRYTHRIDLQAYPSAAENRKADRDERRARNGY